MLLETHLRTGCRAIWFLGFGMIRHIEGLRSCSAIMVWFLPYRCRRTSIFSGMQHLCLCLTVYVSDPLLMYCRLLTANCQLPSATCDGQGFSPPCVLYGQTWENIAGNDVLADTTYTGRLILFVVFIKFHVFKMILLEGTILILLMMLLVKMRKFEHKSFGWMIQNICSATFGIFAKTSNTSPSPPLTSLSVLLSLPGFFLDFNPPTPPSADNRVCVISPLRFQYSRGGDSRKKVTVGGGSG